MMITAPAAISNLGSVRQALISAHPRARIVVLDSKHCSSESLLLRSGCRSPVSYPQSSLEIFDNDKRHAYLNSNPATITDREPT
jgi:hypothetical protein